MTEPAAPATPQEAATLLSTRTGDAAWGGKLLAGDVATQAEFQQLTRLASQADDGAEALAGKLSSPSTVEQHVLVEGVAQLRAQGIDEAVLQQVVAGKAVSRQEKDAVRRLLELKQADVGWTKRLLENDMATRKELTLMSVVLAADVAE